MKIPITKCSDKEELKKARKYVLENRLQSLSSLLHGTAAESIYLRKQYKIRIALLIATIFLMFTIIFIAIAMIGDVEISEFNNHQLGVFIGMILLEFLAIIVSFCLAFSCRNCIIMNTIQQMSSTKMDRAEIVKECRNTDLDFELIIEDVIYSKDEASRAVILRRRDETYEIVFERWHTFDDEELRYTTSECRGIWEPVSTGKTIVDTLEHARKLVEEDAWPI